MLGFGVESVPERPEIPYPCRWTYQVVGEGERELLEHLEAVLAGLAHEKRVTRKSAGGRYTSIEVVLTVESEVQRLELGAAILRHAAVRVVI